MYVNYPALRSTKTDGLIELSKTITFKNAVSNKRRIGENRFENLSVYENSRWYGWSAQQRKAFKSLLPEDLVKRSVVGWFLKIPEESGFLDRMTFWVDKPFAGTVVAYALKDRQVVHLNDQPTSVRLGEGLSFNLKVIHEIKRSRQGQLWACLMVL